MIGYIEWTNKETKEVERASVTRCVAEQGFYHIEFSNPELWSEGRIAIRWGQGEQHIKGMYMFTDGSYKGEADIIGHATKGKDLIDFAGTWHDPEDETGMWDVYIEFATPTSHTLRFSYDDPGNPEML